MSSVIRALTEYVLMVVTALAFLALLPLTMFGLTTVAVAPFAISDAALMLISLTAYLVVSGKFNGQHEELFIW